MEKKNENVIKKIRAELDKIEKGGFKLYFFVYDTDGLPNASLSYIYETALTLKNLEYNVEMLYTEEKNKKFIGVSDWMGEEYASIKHTNVRSNLSVSPSDFLFLPEIHPSVMYDTKSLPCKRVVIIQNFSYLMDMLQPGATLSQYNIYDCITTSEEMKSRILGVFPYMNVNVVPPCVNKVFAKPRVPQKLIVNIVSKHKRDTNEIVKSFFLKYPMFKWVCFRELYNLSKADFSELLQEGSFTLWMDTETSFGHSAMEAMACGNRVLAKVPENPVYWMLDNKGFNNSCVWFNTNTECVDVLAMEIYNYLNCESTSDYEKVVGDILEAHNMEWFGSNVKCIYCDCLIGDRKKEIEEALSVAGAENA